MATKTLPPGDLFVSLQSVSRRPLTSCKCWLAAARSQNLQSSFHNQRIRQYATPTKRPPPVMIQHKPTKLNPRKPTNGPRQPAAPTFNHPTVGTVIKAGYMDKCVVVRTNTQHWDKFLRKHYPSKKQYLCHDPNNSLREGDVIEYGPWEGRNWRNTVRIIVERILSPFGAPIEERPKVLDREERLAKLVKRGRQLEGEGEEKGRRVPKKLRERIQQMARESINTRRSGPPSTSGTAQMIGGEDPLTRTAMAAG